MRGTDITFILYFEYSGIIPACAGNSLQVKLLRQLLRDHPRVCGEQLLCHVSYSSEAGSSPRVRGTASTMQDNLKSGGIIPACAGNSISMSRFAQLKKDHPRVCGEQREGFLPRPTEMGSSPRVRGTVTLRKPAPRLRGIIPACAGNRNKSPHSRKGF